MSCSWRAVAQGRDDAAGHEHAVVGGPRGEHVPGDEEAHQDHEHGLAREPGPGGGHDRRADRDRGRVAGDEEPGRGDGDVEVVAERAEEADDDEFGEADPERAQGECPESEDAAALGDGHGCQVFAAAPGFVQYFFHPLEK